MAKALKVRIMDLAINTVVCVVEVVITLVHENSGRVYTTKLSYSHDHRDVEKLLSKLFRLDWLSSFEGIDASKGKCVAYIPEKDELRSSEEIFSFDDFRKGITEKEYYPTSEFENEYVMLYKRIRGEVAK